MIAVAYCPYSSPPAEGHTEAECKEHSIYVELEPANAAYLATRTTQYDEADLIALYERHTKGNANKVFLRVAMEEVG